MLSRSHLFVFRRYCEKSKVGWGEIMPSSAWRVARRPGACRVNPRPVGRGNLPPPAGCFLNSRKTTARSATKFLVPSRASIWHLPTQFQVIGHLRSGVIEVKLRLCSSKNEQKPWNLEMLTKDRVKKEFQSVFMWSCRAKIWLQNCYLGFSKFWFLNKEIFCSKNSVFFLISIFFSIF